MSNKKSSNNSGIYIGNIPHLLTREHIESLFQKYNIVRASEVCCRGTKAFCFMKLGGETDAINAIREMNNHNINGRKLQVRPYEKKQGTSKQEKESDNDDIKSYTSALTVKNVPPPLETPLKSQNTNINHGTSTHHQSRTPYYNDKVQASSYDRQNTSSTSSNQILHISPQGAGCSHHNTPFSDPHHTSSQASGCHHNSSFSKLNKTLHSSPIEKNAMHSPLGQSTQLSPRDNQIALFRPTGQNKQLSSPNQSTSSQQSDTTSQFPVDLDQSSQESPEKYRYVHCSRNVISYNPRDLENNKISGLLCEHSSLEGIKVWAANFPYLTTKKQILKLFEDFSPLKVRVNNNQRGGDFTRATITLPSFDVAEAAIMELDNTIYKRRTLLVGLVEKDDDYDDDDDDDDYDEDDDYDGDYYEHYDDYSEQGYHHRPIDYHRPNDQEQFYYYEEPVSRRLHNTHLS